MKKTFQQKLILDTILKNREHPTAEQLYNELREQGHNVGIATIYRNLNRLAAEGRIRKIVMQGGGDRFDGNPDAHCHAICTACGAVIDLFECAFEDICERAKKELDFSASDHEMILFGKCTLCQR